MICRTGWWWGSEKHLYPCSASTLLTISSLIWFKEMLAWKFFSLQHASKIPEWMSLWPISDTRQGFSYSKPGAKINEGNVAVELKLLLQGNNSILNTDGRVMWCWSWFWNQMTQNIISIHVFVFGSYTRWLLYKAFISVPVNNYWLLVIIPEELFHLELYFKQLV